jgi:dCMP deaminase
MVVVHVYEYNSGQIMVKEKAVCRPDWDNYFMEIAKVAASRSNCCRRQVAAVIVKDRRVIATGYNGTPLGIKNCYEGGCPRCNSSSPSGSDLDQCLCSHAEENAITQSAYHGISINKSTLYTTYSPCLLCAKMIINSGINEVVYHQRYTIDEVAMKLLHDGGVRVRCLLSETQKRELGID